MSIPPSNGAPIDSEQDSFAAQGICSRILNDMILDLARRYGVGAVAVALADIVGCQSCVTDKARDNGICRLRNG